MLIKVWMTITNLMITLCKLTFSFEVEEMQNFWISTFKTNAKGLKMQKSSHKTRWNYICLSAEVARKLSVLTANCLRSYTLGFLFAFTSIVFSVFCWIWSQGNRISLPLDGLLYWAIERHLLHAADYEAPIVRLRSFSSLNLDSVVRGYWRGMPQKHIIEGGRLSLLSTQAMKTFGICLN